MTKCLIIIALGGIVGGIINALLTDNGFIMPRTEKAQGMTIVRPGWLGNLAIGAIAAIISWGLYGPFPNAVIATAGKASTTIAASDVPDTPAPEEKPEKVRVTLAGLVGAILVGIGGAKWLTNEVDKKLLRAAATSAATQNADPSAASVLGAGTPYEAFRATHPK